jgi:hypothetical protein
MTRMSSSLASVSLTWPTRAGPTWRSTTRTKQAASEIRARSCSRCDSETRQRRLQPLRSAGPAQFLRRKKEKKNRTDKEKEKGQFGEVGCVAEPFSSKKYSEVFGICLEEQHEEATGFTLDSGGYEQYGAGCDEIVATRKVWDDMHSDDCSECDETAGIGTAGENWPPGELTGQKEEHPLGSEALLSETSEGEGLSLTELEKKIKENHDMVWHLTMR